jgi:hypothetical protein
MWREIQLPHRLASSLRRLGEVAARQGDPAAARRSFEEARAIFTELAAPSRMIG